MLIAPVSLVGTMLNQIGGFLPRLAAAIVVLVVGLIVARILAKTVRKALQVAGLDRMADTWGLHDITERVGLGRSLSAVLAGLTRAIVIFVVVLVAVSLMGVPALEQAVSQGILFLPKLVVALAILMVGLVAGNAVKERVDRLARQMDLGGGLGVLAMVGVVALTAIIAAAQVGIPTQFLIMLATTVVAGVVLTAALAIGLGTRHVVSQLAAGRYLGATLAPGGRVRFGDVEGEVVELQGAATVVRTGDGRLLRVPNRVFLDTMVQVEPRPEEPVSAGDAPEPDPEPGPPTTRMSPY